MKFKRKILMAKVETSYGVDAEPTGAANAILTNGLTITPMEGERVSRDLDLPRFGGDQQIHVGTHVKLTFNVEAAASGTKGVAPAFGPVLRGCGLAETVTEGVNVEYTPISESEESLTMFFVMDGNLHAMVGARGSMSLKLDAKAIPYFGFEYTGLWVDPSAISQPVADYSAFQSPLPVTNDNTSILYLGGQSYPFASLEMKQGNEVSYRHLVGEERVIIGDRAATGSLSMVAPELSIRNWFTVAKSNEMVAFQVVHGTVGGQTIQLQADSVQVLSPNYADLDGFAMLSADLSFVPSGGDDDFLIRFL